ncbi:MULTISPECIES: DUF7168 domain-containing protein [Cysteiniphilum]|uniref:DUF7168 domain-containing protein n=1 Tax=Cysteiniphilum TaxID=2056696 RepID=UPI00177B12A9|nr:MULTISPECIES: hypothetical protein [Cysteiniphilum]
MQLVEKSYKQKIEEHAVNYFKDLHCCMPPQMIARTISFFEFSLSKEGLVDNGDDEIVHSDFIKISKSLATDLKPVVLGVASIYGTKPLKIHNKGSKPSYAFSFVGYQGDAHACYVSLNKLIEFIKEVRKEYIASTIEEVNIAPKQREVNGFVHNWIAQLSSHLNPTALTGDNFERINQYISKHFKTSDDEHQYNKDILKLLQLFAKATDQEMTGKEFAEHYHKKTGQTIEQLAERENKLNGLPLIVNWL